MRRFRRDIEAHRLSASLFMLYWMAAYGVMAASMRTPLPHDMPALALILNLLVPFSAGGLVAWWRAFRPGTRTTPRGRVWRSAVVGAIMFTIDGILVIAPDALAYRGGEDSLLNAFIKWTITFAAMGAALGALGAVASETRLHLQKNRWKREKAASTR